MTTIKNLSTRRVTAGGDIVSGASKLASKLGMPLKNWHLPGHKYTGPFTELDKRIDINGNPLPGFEPYNQIDNIALHHDFCYKTADESKLKTRKDCDKAMLDELDAVKTRGIREKIDYTIVKPIIWAKYKLGLGLNHVLAKELHKPITRKFKRRRVYVSNINKIWSADLMDRQKLSKQNKGYKYLLTVIDVFSKYAYCAPLKSKSQQEVTEAFEKLFIRNKPEKIWTDQGTEFFNKTLKKHLKDHNIELYHVHNEGKACVIERFNRTLGEMIQLHLTATNSKKYINKVQEFIDDYNNKYHSTIKMTPFQATDPKNKIKVLKNTLRYEKPDKSTPKFNIDDRVRIYSYKTIFDKGHKHNWTSEIFVVCKINYTNPITYEIKDLAGESIIGSFYAQELQHTQF